MNKNCASAAHKHGTPVYVYDEQLLRKQADAMLAFPHAYGLTVRYAMKACSNKTITQLFNSLGLHIDASSGYEVERAMLTGIPPEKILLTAQEMPSDETLCGFVKQGVLFTACSLHQLERYGQLFPNHDISLRCNPGLGSGSSRKTNVGGPSSSFGIWHETLNDAQQILQKYGLHVIRLHTHIGSGTEPSVWVRAAKLSLNIVKNFPDVTILNLGGGFKVARVPDEHNAKLSEIGSAVKNLFEGFWKKTGRKLHLEIEPGTTLVANAGILISRIIDIVSTSKHTFLKLDCGMTEILRPSLYGAQHPIELIAGDGRTLSENKRYVVVGHCCESGDLLTPLRGKPETLDERELPEARIGDYIIIGGAGAYCSSMSAINYNSFPRAAEIMLATDGSFKLIRKRQTMQQIIENETG